MLVRRPQRKYLGKGRLVTVAKSWGISGKSGVFKSQRAATVVSSRTTPWKVTISHILWDSLGFFLALHLGLRYQDGSCEKVCPSGIRTCHLVRMVGPHVLCVWRSLPILPYFSLIISLLTMPSPSWPSHCHPSIIFLTPRPHLTHNLPEGVQDHVTSESCVWLSV